MIRSAGFMEPRDIEAQPQLWLLSPLLCGLQEMLFPWLLVSCGAFGNLVSSQHPTTGLDHTVYLPTSWQALSWY